MNLDNNHIDLGHGVLGDKYYFKNSKFRAETPKNPPLPWEMNVIYGPVYTKRENKTSLYTIYSHKKH